MNPNFERDKLYPWSVQLQGDKWVPQNLVTNERLAPCDTYSDGHRALEKHLENVKANTVNAGAALTTS